MEYRSTILVIHGPNLHLMGKLSVKTGTRLTLSKVDRLLRKMAQKHAVRLRIFHHFSEGKILKCISTNRNRIQGIIFAPGALAWSCFTIAEIVAVIQKPLVEVHLSEFPESEQVFQQSCLKDVAAHRLLAPGEEAYLRALRFLIDRISRESRHEPPG